MDNILNKTLYGQPFYQIIAKQYLDIKDLFKIRQVCNKWRKKITIDYMENIIANKVSSVLNKIFGNKLMEIIKYFNCVISGSFILQVIYDQWWDGDIDIYLSKKYFGDIIKIFETINTGLDYKIDILENKNLSYGGNTCAKISSIANIRYSNNVKLQFIALDIGEDNDKYDEIIKIRNNISNTFDLDICKNAIYFDDGKLCCNLMYPTNVITKTSNFPLFFPLNKTIGRVSKYVGRGIQLYDKYNINDYITFYMYKKKQKFCCNFDNNAYKIYKSLEKDKISLRNGTIINHLDKYVIGECDDYCIFKMFKINIVHYHGSTNLQHTKYSDGQILIFIKNMIDVQYSIDFRKLPTDLIVTLKRLKNSMNDTNDKYNKYNKIEEYVNNKQSHGSNIVINNKDNYKINIVKLSTKIEKLTIANCICNL